MRPAPVLALIATAALAACAPRAAPPPVATVTPPPAPAPRAGLERVLGATPEAAIALLGSPTLDRTEGRARQLQFTRGACVLDLFFYPSGPALAARYADARLKDGRALDPASCLQSQLLATN